MTINYIQTFLYNINTHVMYRWIMVTRLFIHEGDYFLHQFKKRIIIQKKKARENTYTEK